MITASFIMILVVTGQLKSFKKQNIEEVGLEDSLSE